MTSLDGNRSNTKRPSCKLCGSFRELSLHLHELAIYCELRGEELPVFKKVGKDKIECCGVAKTSSVAKWLRLASQLESVEMNTFKYEEAHIYCEPIADELYSDLNHASSIATQITRFIFISNALEEAYRLTSRSYKKYYASLSTKGSENKDWIKYNSIQSALLLKHFFFSLKMPENYFHKVDSLIELAKRYKDRFDLNFEMDLSDTENVSRGFSAVRIIRNHIAHAVFPIVENPQYTSEFTDPVTKRLALTLLQRASRVAAMNIQVILGFSRATFDSERYYHFSLDPDTGEAFKEIFIDSSYLNHLHIEQLFGLNESLYWAWRRDLLDN